MTSDQTHQAADPPKTFCFTAWRHGGWYVHDIIYPNGGVGCVSRNFKDRKWRIVCHPAPFEEQPTSRTRHDAALAEWHLVQALCKAAA